MSGTIKHYTNKELARKYIAKVRKVSSGTDYHHRLKKLIEDAPINISDFYQRHKSLNKINLKGIGEVTRSTLEELIDVPKVEKDSFDPFK